MFYSFPSLDIFAAAATPHAHIFLDHSKAPTIFLHHGKFQQPMHDRLVLGVWGWGLPWSYGCRRKSLVEAGSMEGAGAGR